MSAEHREWKYKTIIFGIAVIIILGSMTLVARDRIEWAAQVASIFAAAYIGIYIADHFSKHADERAREVVSALALDKMKEMIGDTVSFAAIPRERGDPYPPGMKLFIYYVSGNHRTPRYWQLSVVTVDFRIAAGTWVGCSTIQNADDEDYPYRMEILAIKDMLVVTSCQAREQERSAVYVFDGKTPEQRVFGILSHLDWRRQPRLDPAILAWGNPVRFSSGDVPSTSQRIEDPGRMAELDEYYNTNLSVIGQIDACFNSLS